jgi:hypothetical protein
MHSFLVKIIKTATTDLMIVDPNLDETFLREFAGSAAEGIPIRMHRSRAFAKAASSGDRALGRAVWLRSAFGSQSNLKEKAA